MVMYFEKCTCRVKILPSMVMYLEKSTISSEDVTFDCDVFGKVYEFE